MGKNTIVTADKIESVLLNLGSLRKPTQKNVHVLLANVLSPTEAGVNILSCSQMDKAELSTRSANHHHLLIDRKNNKRVIAIGSRSECDGLCTLDKRFDEENKTKMVATAKCKEQLKHFE